MKEKHILQTEFHGDPNVGLYGVASDEVCLLGSTLFKKYGERIEAVLKVPVKPLSVGGTSLVGLFVVMNSNGLLLPKIVTEEELKIVEKLGLRYAIIESKYTALGNLILCNDKGAVVSPLLKKQKKIVEETLGVKAKIGTVAQLSIVGSCGVATNKGCLLHRDVMEEEMGIVEKTLGVNADIGTVNFGTPFVKSGLIANSNGFVVGKMTTGPEIVRVDEALGFLK
ncbi:MAG: translation initiation factor IF-6 [Candidatus Aenigmarchaeota archaeon]|nr:translation initiation factor IF-6 [Candidatus Aenigmarchaeota archaeon]